MTAKTTKDTPSSHKVRIVIATHVRLCAAPSPIIDPWQLGAVQKSVSAAAKITMAAAAPPILFAYAPPPPTTPSHHCPPSHHSFPPPYAYGPGLMDTPHGTFVALAHRSSITQSLPLWTRGCGCGCDALTSRPACKAAAVPVPSQRRPPMPRGSNRSTPLG
eukprot:COSAG01_NODE_228_length_21104_cov_210.303832_32_plen_161_part_00